jgi:hypothetical protein
MKMGMHVRWTKQRKAQACGNLEDHEILLHYALKQPVFINRSNFREGRLLRDVEVGGRVILLIQDPDEIVPAGYYRSDKIIDIEEDVVLTSRGFYRLTIVTPPAHHRGPLTLQRRLKIRPPLSDGP